MSGVKSAKATTIRTYASTATGHKRYTAHSATAQAAELVRSAWEQAVANVRIAQGRVILNA